MHLRPSLVRLARPRARPPPRPLPPNTTSPRKPPTSNASPVEPSKPDPTSSLKYRRIPLIFGGISGAALVLYIVAVYRGYRADVEKYAEVEIPADTSDRYIFTAKHFDRDVNSFESISGINKRRKELCAKARGHVLEVSVGTGRNHKYLPLLKGIKSVTMADKNREMLDLARRKWPEEGNAWFIRTSFFQRDCSTEKIPCPNPDGFDTIVQTMGLCSCPEPEKLLRNLGEMCNPNGGRILLLEHGRGYYGWLNRFLDSTAPAHADRHGCWFNKDIGEIVQRSGLEVVEAKRFHFGTTWWFELKPSAQKAATTSSIEISEAVSSPKASSASSWLGFWG